MDEEELSKAAEQFKELEHKLIAIIIHAGAALAVSMLFKLGINNDSFIFIVALIAYLLSYGFWYITEQLNVLSANTDDAYLKWTESKKEFEKINKADQWNKKHRKFYKGLRKSQKSLDKKATSCRTNTFIFIVLGWTITFIGVIIALVISIVMQIILFSILGIGIFYLCYRYFGAAWELKKLQLLYDNKSQESENG